MSRGDMIGRVSSESFSRCDDERYLYLSELMESANGRAVRYRTCTVERAAVSVEADRGDAGRPRSYLPDPDHSIAHPLGLRLARHPRLSDGGLPQPASSAARRHKLLDGLTSHRAEQVKTLETDSGRVEWRAVTGPAYTRIYDHQLIAAV